ncbi:MAG TPA: bacillithiol system redox-active protein YtxJ [Candidatus Hydrogenedentes bacterium]|nr:bacillithiol system redox-active protein YtxJ [Candidatus Hydrogenedentota bacterium]HQH70207.1 bacillithiol system redox-active protein YtxJ [Candidatus Hydrogenedentota bacterium]HQM49399.1 bacillithiol system redox-active protein YtxJ [Candidatus Hydrogenedentota bacterium]
MKELRSQQDWQACLDVSAEKPVFVFKHSTSCPISGAAHSRVTEYEKQTAGQGADVYMVKVIESRPVSNRIAEDLGVQHQSPQVILVKDRAAVWSASHHGVRGERMQEAFESAAP